MNPEPLFNWINERHRIYLRRAAGEPAPWTSDPILQKYKFTNVFRELDRVTIWVRENIRQPFEDHPDLWIMLALARYVNWPPALWELVDANLWPPGNPQFKIITGRLEARRAAGEKTETGAYMIRAESNTKTEWYHWSKQKYIVEVVVKGMWDKLRLLPVAKRNGATLEATNRAFESCYGVGGFMAYEIVTDLRHCPGWLDTAPDIMTWANPGPGAYRGLNRLAGRPLAARGFNALAEMRELLDMSPLYLAPHVPALEMRDIEHSLCETDKYLRALEGGRPRSMFKPTMEEA